MRRSSVRRGGALALALAASLSLCRTGRVHAEGEPKPGDARPSGAAVFEATPGTFAAIELGHGGRPLYQRLFPSGWPTTREFRQLTLESGEAAFNDGVGAILASGLGVPLSVSASERARVEERSKQDPKIKSVDDALRDRFEQFRQFAGMPTGVDKDFSPTFIPFRRGDPTFAKNYEPERPWTWTWDSKGADQTVTLDALGLSMHAFALYAQTQLTVEHVASVGGSNQNCVGRTDVDGFLGLVALNCAVASMNEARLKLCMDSRGEKEELAAYPPKYDPQSEYGKSTYYPHAYVPTVNKATVTWALASGSDAKKSRLFDQAALLLGVCEVIKASSGKGGTARFFSTDKKTGFFDPATAEQATAFATFLVECLSRLHAQSGNWSSFADRALAGPSLRADDAGIALMALSAFLSIKPDKSDISAAQKKASVMLERISSFMMNVQKTSNPPNTGFCDTYSLAGEGAAAEFAKPGEERRSLAAQGLMVRGLLAAKAACDLPQYSGAKKQAQLRESATQVMRWLEDKRWNKEKKLYLDPNEPTKLRALDAFAVLGALRDMALDTSDVRYLLRYKAQLASVRAAGLVVSESTRGRSGSSVVRSTAEAKRAPVVAAEANLP